MVDIHVEQMKLSLADFSKQPRDRMDLSELEKEVEAMKLVVEEIKKWLNGVAEF